jgi:hypothetical protein
MDKDKQPEEYKTAHSYMETLLKCKELCHNPPHDDPNYKLCKDGLPANDGFPAKLEQFFHTVGIGTGEVPPAKSPWYHGLPKAVVNHLRGRGTFASRSKLAGKHSHQVKKPDHIESGHGANGKSDGQHAADRI